MRNRRDHLLRQLAKADPLRHRREDEEEILSGASDVLQELRSSEPAGRSHLISARRSRLRPRIVAAGVVAAAAIVLVVPLAITLDTESNSPLVAAAAAAAERPPAEFPYTARLSGRMLDEYNDGDRRIVFLAPFEEDVRIDNRGSALVKRRFAAPIFATPDDEAEFLENQDELAFDRPEAREPTVERFGPGKYPASIYSGLPPAADLPSDPEQLERTLRRAACCTDQTVPYLMFDLIARLLVQPVVDPELGRGLYLVAARLDGVRDLGTVRDADGREGRAVAISSPSPSGRAERRLIFDPNSGQALADETRVLQPGSPSNGALVDYTTIHLDERP